MTPFMRLRLVDMILDSIPKNRLKSTDQLPSLMQSWLSLVSMSSRLLSNKLGELAWPVHDVARRVFCTGIWLNMPGRKCQHNLSAYSSGDLGADGLVLGFYAYLCTKLMTEYGCSVQALDGILCTAMEQVLSPAPSLDDDKKDKRRPSTPSAQAFPLATVINHTKQAHSKIWASLDVDIEKLIALQNGTGRDVARLDELLMHCINLGRLYHALRLEKSPSVQEQRQPRVWRLAKARSVSDAVIRKLLIGPCDNQYAAREYDSFVEGKGSSKQELEIIEILNTPADAVMAALSHPHSGHFIHLPDIRLYQLPLAEGGFNTLLVMKRSARFGFSRWGATQILKSQQQQHHEPGFIPYTFTPLLLQMLFSGWETGGPAFGFALVREMCGLSPAVELSSWSAQKIGGLLKDIYDIFTAGADGCLTEEGLRDAAMLLPLFLATETEDMLRFDMIGGKKIEDEVLERIILGAGQQRAHAAWMEAARYLGASPQLMELAKRFQYKNVKTDTFMSVDTNLGDRCTSIEDEKLPVGHRFGTYELKEQARNAKATAVGNSNQIQVCEMEGRDQFWWQVLAILEQNQHDSKGSIRQPVASLFAGAHETQHICIHQHDVPIGKVMSPNTGTSFVYLDQHFPVWSLSWDQNPNLDIGHRPRHILERFKSKVQVNRIAPVQRMQTTTTTGTGNKRKAEAEEHGPSSPIKKQKTTPSSSSSSSSSSKVMKTTASTMHVTIGQIQIHHGKTTMTTTTASPRSNEKEEGESEDDSYYPNDADKTPEEFIPGKQFSQFGSMDERL
jgi:hypothetical protein